MPQPLPKTPSEMTDEELLRFGMVAKHMCSQGVQLEQEQLEAVNLQLREGREEWNRRFPKLPLASTF